MNAAKEALQGLIGLLFGRVQRQAVMLSPEGQLADLQKQNAALTQELEKANDKLKANLAASEAAALDWQKFDGCLQKLKQMDDTSLKAEFKQFADICPKEAENSAAEEASTNALGKCRLSKEGLVSLFTSKNKTLSKEATKALTVEVSYLSSVYSHASVRTHTVTHTQITHD